MTDQEQTPDPTSRATAPADPDSTRNSAHDSGHPNRPERLMVVTPDGMAVTGSSSDPSAGPATQIEEPAKVMRIGAMVKQLLEEVRGAPLDDAGRARLASIHNRSLDELEKGLAPELVEELRRISLPFSEATPSDAELRIAQAQLVGWLEGLFHGIQTALLAQQMAARAQLDQMRRALPGPAAAGGTPPGAGPGTTGHDGPEHGQGHPTGQYL